jgi:hypothetical protein
MSPIDRAYWVGFFHGEIIGAVLLAVSYLIGRFVGRPRGTESNPPWPRGANFPEPPECYRADPPPPSLRPNAWGTHMGRPKPGGSA